MQQRSISDIFCDTTYKNNHCHKWNEDSKLTTICNNHYHKIDINRQLALSSGLDNHTHRLIFHKK